MKCFARRAIVFKPQRMSGKRILVVGAGGALGRAITARLSALGHDPLAAYRTPKDGLEDSFSALGATPVRLDLDDRHRLEALLENADGAIFTPILTVSAPAADALRDAMPTVFFSSNNVAVDPENEIYARLGEAERETLAAAPQAVILRPTMIYGYPEDGNLSRLIKAMRRLPFAPMPGNGAALQQPIYYRDLADMAVDALFSEEMRGQVFAAAGPEPMSQKALFAAAAAAAGTRLRALHLPLSVMAPAAAMAERLGLRFFIKAAQLRRASADKTPQGTKTLLGWTSLEEGLKELVRALDGGGAGA